MTSPERLRALLAEPGFVVMPAVWDGLTAKLTAKAGFRTAFQSGSCVAASRLGGPDLDLLSVSEMLDSFRQVREAAPDLLVLADGDHGFGNAMNRVPRLPGRRRRDPPRRRGRRGTAVLCRPVAGRTPAVAAAAGRPSFVVLSPGAPRATPSRERAAELGFKIGTYPTAMLSPVVGAIKAGLAALNAGQAEAASALEPAVLRDTLGYGDYENQARRLTSSD